MSQGSFPRKNIAQTFADLRQRRQIALMPFISAGYPDLEATALSLLALEKAGANLIEIGFPFSDPIADGPTIQASYTAALQKRITIKQILATIRSVRDRLSVPLVAMLSHSLVYRYGIERFVTDAKAAGFDAVLIPDLPPPEAQQICATVQKGGLDTVLLIAPTTTPSRRKEIAALCSGFVYYLSVAGITGQRAALATDLPAQVRELKSLTDRPICVGFGISKPEHIRDLAGFADGAIVGSAVVAEMTRHAAEGSQAVADAVGAYCRQLLSLVR
jgi:tryptophan synthase alpha chain